MAVAQPQQSQEPEQLQPAIRWQEGVPHPFTYADLDRLPEDTPYRYEILEGTLLVNPAPFARHQRAVARLHLLLAAAAPSEFEVMLSPFDWKIDEENVLEPDLLVIRREDVPEDAKNLQAPAVLAVEVLSGSRRTIDLAAKPAVYARGGLADYWVVDPVVPSLIVFARDATGVLQRVAEFRGDEPYEASRPFPVTVVPSALTMRRP